MSAPARPSSASPEQIKAETDVFPLQRVAKVDTLLDGDAGSRRLAILALLPLSPPVPPLLLKNSGNTRVSAIFRL